MDPAVISLVCEIAGACEPPADAFAVAADGGFARPYVNAALLARLFLTHSGLRICDGGGARHAAASPGGDASTSVCARVAQLERRFLSLMERFEKVYARGMILHHEV